MSHSTSEGSARRVDSPVKFNVLGPVTVVDGTGSLNIGGPKQRTVLAMLIAHVGRPVSNDLIVEAVYGEDSPDRGRRRVQTYVSTLRSIVGDVIVKEGSGWALRVDRSRVDAVRFEDLYESVRDDADMPAETVGRVLREALSLWRGHPYSDIESHGHLDAEISRLAELRVAVQAARIDADLESGRHADLIGEIEGLIAEHPYLERFRAQHMLALYRAGRQREALRSYEEMRTLLVAEMGVDPTPDLQGLEQRILEQDVSLDLAPRKQIQKKAVLVADPGDPIELARLPSAEREELLSMATSALDRVVGGGVLLPAGSASYAVFDSVGEAAAAAEAMTLRTDGAVMRMAIDFGDVEVSDGSVSGAPVARGSVLVSVAHRGQVLLSADAQQAVVSGEDGTGLRFESLGRFELAGIQDPTAVHQLLVGDPPATFPPLDTDRTPVPLPDGRDRSVPGYELREPIGPGSVGTFYRAYQPSLGREVMVEVIGRAEASDPEFIRNFEADAQRLALLDHPNINPLLDYWRDPEGAFLVYRYHRGGLLDNGPLDEPDRLIEQIGRAISHAHSYGVVHGSVRPDRVVLDESGNGYLMGFPLAGVAPKSSPDYAAYIAPETLAGEPATEATDVFGLGVLALELREGPVTGDVPLRPESPVIARAVSEDPSARYQSVAKFFEELYPGSDEPGERFTETRNPYKGLAAFHESDAGDFFGRGAVVGELVAALTEDRFLAVVGPSGIGKSSVVRAGLIPALREGAIDGSGDWLITDMLPGPRPFLELERALERMAVDLPADVRERFAERDLNALAGLSRVLPDGKELLVVIDQFEELFTMTDEGVASAFLDLLVSAVELNQARIVVTLRADFLDRPLLYSEFGELLRDSMIGLRSPSPAELGEAIMGPARGVVVDVDAALVERLVSEVHDRPGGLPLLQFALVELFESRESDLLTLEAHEEIGGVTGSLTRRAEAVYEGLDADQQSSIKQVFLRLVTVVEGASPTRRRVRITELGDLDAEQAIDAFARNRMLVFDNDPDTRAPTVEVAHEALLIEWPRLAGWIESTREDLTLSRRLDEAIRDWEANERDDAYLLTGGRLAQHQTWTSGTSLLLTEREQGFLASSTAYEESLRARRRRRRTVITAGFGFAAVVATVFGIVAFQQAEDADAAAERALANEQQALESEQDAIDAAERATASEERATENAKIARANALVASATAAMDEDAELALLLALEGASTVPEDLDAMRVLRRALRAPVTVYSGVLDSESFLFFADMSPDGRYLVGSGQSGIELREVDSGETLWVYEHGMGGREGISVPAFVNGGSEIAVGLAWAPVEDDPFGDPPEAVGVHILDAETGTLERRFDTGPCGATLAPRNRTVGGASVVIETPRSGWYDEFGCGRHPSTDLLTLRNRILDVNTQSFADAGDSYEIGPSASGFSIAFDTNGVYRLFYSRDDDLVTVEEIATGQEVFRLPSAPIAKETEISQDGSLVVLGGSAEIDSRELHVYEMGTGAEAAVLEGHSGNTWDSEFTADGELLATTGEDGLIKIWDPRTGDLVQSITTIGDNNGFVWLSEDASRIGVLGIQSVSVVSLDHADSAEVGALEICGEGQPFYAGAGIDVQADRALVYGSCGGALGARGTVFDLTTMSVVVRGPVASSQGYALSPDGGAVASQEWAPPDDTGPGKFGTAVLTDLESGETTRMEGLCEREAGIDDAGCEAPGEGPYAAAAEEFDFSPDGRLLAMSSFTADGQVWLAETGESLAIWPFSSAAFTPDGTKIVSVDSVETPARLQVHSTEDFSLLDSHEFDEGWFLNWIVVAGDGSTVVGGQGPDIVFFDIETLNEVGRWAGAHDGQVRQFDVSDDGSMLASIGFDGFAKVWDLETGGLLHDIQVSEDDRGQAIAFANDDRHLLVSVAGGPLAIYTLDEDELFEIARDRLVRGFTESECLQYFPDTDCPTLEEMKAGS